MKASQLLNAFALMTFAASIAACSAKVEATDGSPQTPIIPPSTQSEMAGTWKVPCSAYQGFYVQMTMTLGTSNMKTKADIYSDPQCASLLGSQSQTGTYIVGGALNVPAGATAIDYNLKDDATGQQKVTYDIYKVAAGKLYVGKNPGSTPNMRPIEFDTALVFQKVR